MPEQPQQPQQWIPNPLVDFIVQSVGGGADWRQNFAGQPYPVQPGQPTGVQDVLPAIQAANQVQQQLGPEAFDKVTGARVGKDVKGEVARAMGNQDLTQNELAAMQRFLQGQDIGKAFGPGRGMELATAINALYGADKALSQNLGRGERFIPYDQQQFGPSTSDASIGNFLAAQAGMAQGAGYKPGILDKFIIDLLSGKIFGERGPGARTQPSGGGPPRG